MRKTCIIRKVLLCIIRWCPYFKNVKMALNSFCDKTLQMFNMLIKHIHMDAKNIQVTKMEEREP